MTRDRRVAYNRVVCRVVKPRPAARDSAAGRGISRKVPLVGRDPKSTPLSRKAEEAAREGRAASTDREGPAGGYSSTEAASREVAKALMPFLLRDDGWLRIVPQDDGLTCYFKWKWTGGPHINHYVMVRYPYTESGDALARLARKVDSVDRGEQRPVKDHYFKG